MDHYFLKRWGRPPVHHSVLKAKCDEALSNSAFNFNLRRYNEEEAGHPGAVTGWSVGNRQYAAASLIYSMLIRDSAVCLAMAGSNPCS